MNWEQYWTEVRRQAALKGIDMDQPGLAIEMTPAGLEKMLRQAHGHGYTYGFKAAQAIDKTKQIIRGLFDGLRFKGGQV